MNAHQQALIEKIPDRSLVILKSATLRVKSFDAYYPFHQDTDFYYLTESELFPAFWVLKKFGESVHRILFYTPRPESQQKWVGREVALSYLRKHPAWDEHLTLESFEGWAEKEVEQADSVFVSYQQLPDLPRKLALWLYASARTAHRRGRFAPSVMDVYRILGPLRQIKSDLELKKIQRACDISAEAHMALMKRVTPEMTEIQVASLFEYQCLQNGASSIAFSTIVASGRNATVLHYEPSETRLGKDVLVLVDAGCEYQHYTSDITRVFPTSGTFTQEQATLYDLVLRTQESVIEIIKPGVPYEKLQSTAIRTLAEGLRELGVLKGSMDQILENKKVEKYYYHNIGHFMGMDVHDMGPYKNPEGASTLLQPGMVLTVEPGLYFFDEDSPDAFKGIGIRIEDDVCVTTSGSQVLTSKVPKQRKAIEDLRKEVV
jgi:Xaa-Pro aminopeptidase